MTLPQALVEDHQVQLRPLIAAIILLGVLSVLVWRGQQASVSTEELHPPKRLVVDSLGPTGVMAFSYGLPGKSVHLERVSVGVEDGEKLLALGIGERKEGLPEPNKVYLWEVSFDDAPERRMADRDRAADAEEVLRDLQVIAEMEAPADLRPFRISRDGVRFEVLDGSKKRHRYEVGGLSPDGEKRYLLHRASDRLLLINRDSLEVFEKDPWAFVEARLFPIDPTSIREVTIEGLDVGRPIQLEQRPDGWFLRDGPSLAAGTSEVRDFLRRAASLREDTPEQPGPPRSAELSLTVRDGNGVSARLDFSPLPEARMWSAHASGDLLPSRARGRTFQVERSTTEFLRVTPTAFLPGAADSAEPPPEVEK